VTADTGTRTVAAAVMMYTTAFCYCIPTEQLLRQSVQEIVGASTWSPRCAADDGPRPGGARAGSTSATPMSAGSRSGRAGSRG
jgi:hypothetical protein